MPAQLIKKDAVKEVRARLKTLLAPYGFRPLPRQTNRFLRPRDLFLDEIWLDTYGTHLRAEARLYCRCAPFAPLHLDYGRLWRSVKDQINGHLFWECEIPDQGPYYYDIDHFETIWQNTAHAIPHALLPNMEALTMDRLFLLLTENTCCEQDFFRPQSLIFLKSSGWPGIPESAVYGTAKWRLGQYEEGLPYLLHAQPIYQKDVAAHAGDINRVQSGRAAALGVLDDLLALWTNRQEGWETAIQSRIDQVSEHWQDYLI